MVMKSVYALALVGIFAAVLGRPPVTVEANAADFDAICSRARQDLREGRCDEALKAMTVLEGTVRANVEREPGRELHLLIIKARAYWHRMDTQGLERFLTQFESDYADTSAAGWVRRAACYERMLGHRFAGDLPRAAEAFVQYRELEVQAATGQTDTLDAAARDFDLYVKMPTEIGNLYRYLGRMDLALAQYRSALEYATNHAGTLAVLDESPEPLVDPSLAPMAYRTEILPTAIRACQAPQDSLLGVLGRGVACEAQQADWLLAVGRDCCQPRALAAAREHYRRARQALEAHQNAMESLLPTDKARYFTLGEQIAEGLDACETELAKLGASKF